MSLSQLRQLRRAGHRPSRQIMVIVGRAPRDFDDRPTEVVIEGGPGLVDLSPLVGLTVNVVDMVGDPDVMLRVLAGLQDIKAEVVGMVGAYGAVGLNPDHERLLRRYRELLCTIS